MACYIRICSGFYFIFLKSILEKETWGIGGSVSCQRLIQINIVAEVCKMSRRFISRILVCHKNPFLAQCCQCCFFHSLWDAVPRLKIWLVLINASTAQRHLAVMACRISCCVGSVLQDGTMVSEMCWNALLLRWSVQAWVWVALSHRKLSMKKKSVFVCLVYLQSRVSSAFMLPQLHANVYICICSKWFTYVSLWHCTQEKERSCVD